MRMHLIAVRALRFGASRYHCTRANRPYLVYKAAFSLSRVLLLALTPNNDDSNAKLIEEIE